MGMVRKLPEPESAQYDMYVSFEGLVNSRKNLQKAYHELGRRIAAEPFRAGWLERFLLRSSSVFCALS